ncbi:hypothetical protein CYLTODRAFT_423285, partial [Cylindrobasidium torrendii FP15055 ss-10]
MELTELQYHTRTLVSFVTPYASRIIELAIFLPSSAVKEFSPLRERMTSLSSLLLHDTPRAKWNDMHFKMPPFEGCPLKRLVLRDVDFPSTYVAGKLSDTWVNIVHLELLATPNGIIHPGLSLEQIVEVLGLTRHLRTAVIHLEHAYSMGDFPEVDITCPQLVHLTINWHDDQYPLRLATQLINSLTFPALEHLIFDNRVSRPRQSIPSFTSFASVVTAIERSRAPLKSLQCSNGSFGYDDILRLCEVAPHLESLVIHRLVERRDGPSWVRALMPDESHAVLLPRLRVLGLGGDLDEMDTTLDVPKVALDIIAMAHRRRALGSFQMLMADWKERSFSKSPEIAMRTLREEFANCVGFQFRDNILL